MAAVDATATIKKALTDKGTNDTAIAGHAIASEIGQSKEVADGKI